MQPPYSDTIRRELGSEYANVTVLFSSHLSSGLPIGQTHWKSGAERARGAEHWAASQGTQLVEGGGGGKGTMEDTQHNTGRQGKHNFLVLLGAS